MSSLNKVMLIGNVGSDPEIRYSQEGVPFASFSLATNEQRIDKKTGEKQKVTQWHRIVAIGKQADLCKQYVKKGSKLYIEGSLKHSSYEKDGHTFHSTEIILKQINFLSSRQEAEGERREEGTYALIEENHDEEYIPF